MKPQKGQAAAKGMVLQNGDDFAATWPRQGGRPPRQKEKRAARGINQGCIHGAFPLFCL